GRDLLAPPGRPEGVIRGGDGRGDPPPPGESGRQLADTRPAVADAHPGSGADRGPRGGGAALMPDGLLDFEEPIAVLFKEIEALEALPRTDARDREIEQLRRRVVSVREDLYRALTPWQRVLVARHPNRPDLGYFIEHVFTGFTEIHGDRRFADDHAIITGFAEFQGQPALVVGHEK